MISTWSESDLTYLRSNYKKKSYAEIASELGKSAKAVKSKARVLGICISRSWPADHIAILRRDYPTMTAKAIAAAIGREEVAVQRMANSLGLKKCDNWHRLPQSGVGNLAKGVKARFERGLTPWNKGKKTGPAHPNTKKTQFTKGSRPHNTLPLGSIVKTTGDEYKKLKIAEPNVWVFLHRYTWEQHNGPIPEGCLVSFKDGDRNNCDIENLKLETKTEHALRNSIWKFPKDIIPVIATLADLKKELAHAEEKQNGRSA